MRDLAEDHAANGTVRNDHIARATTSLISVTVTEIFNTQPCQACGQRPGTVRMVFASGADRAWRCCASRARRKLKARAPKQESALDDFGRDLTAEAASGRIDPVIGRAEEIEQTVEILARRRKNNAVLIGEAGVGKTAIAEGLALRIHRARRARDARRTRGSSRSTCPA